MSFDGDGYVLIDPDAYLTYLPRAQLALPQWPVASAAEHAEDALTALRSARASQWRSALADMYRDELDELARQVARVRSRLEDAERSYRHLEYVARANGE
ncbi:hypothetical protein [Demequina aurantiaca]|uniref:hypothetical protein n=1 Tax=Demequina aurantiaca TaxID=676200 RepID=UPI003D33AF44